MTTTIAPTRTFTATALDAELGRRRNNKKRAPEDKARAKSFVLPKLTEDDVAAIKAGAVVTVTFKSGRTEHVGLKG